jgi:hypothetical protein
MSQGQTVKDFKYDTLSSEPYKPIGLLDIPSDVAKASVRVILVAWRHISEEEKTNPNGAFFTVDKL